jgi:fatty acid-binding protein DegV
MLNYMKENHLKSGKVRIAHCMNSRAAKELKQMILEAFPNVDVQIHPCRILCSYYAEKGGMLVGFEKF